MNGQPWQDVCNAFRLFLHKRVGEQATSDLVSVIQFDHTADVVVERAPLQSNLELPDYNGGGTQFIPPLITALNIIRSSQTAHIPVLVFMSDGEAAEPHETVLGVMTALMEYCPSLNVHTIGFGHDASHHRLQVCSTSTRCPTVDNDLMSGNGNYRRRTIPPCHHRNRSVECLCGHFE